MSRAGDLHYVHRGPFYVEWGDGLLIHVGRLGIRWKFRVWRIK